MFLVPNFLNNSRLHAFIVSSDLQRVFAISFIVLPCVDRIIISRSKSLNGGNSCFFHERESNAHL